jgi:hypothetical protein
MIPANDLLTYCPMITEKLPLRNEKHLFKQEYQPPGRKWPPLDIWQ